MTFSGGRLNREQEAAVKHAGGHALVLAGAGTGKTKTIIHRIAHLIENGVDPRRILLLTFTRRAAREMTDRLRKMVGKSADNIISGTFHHYCLMTMRRMQKDFNIAGATVIDRDDQEQLMRLARARYVEKKEVFPKAGPLTDLYSYARNTNQSRQGYLKKFTEYDEKTIGRIIKVFEDYDRRKKACNYLDFDDILFRFARVLHSSPAIRAKLRRRYDHILVDEMQDTNPLQWLILDGLRDPAKLFCVGDDAQSIYAFRGADFRNVHSFTERCPNSTVLKLQENYRSTQEILDLANWLLAESPLKYNKKLRASRGKGIRPRLIEFEDDLSEAEWIANDLLERHENGAAWKEHMVISRTGFGARAVEAELIARRIPYVFIGGVSFLQSAHVKDLLCLVRCAMSHHDLIAWMRYLTLWPKVGDVTADRMIAGMQPGKSIRDALELLRKHPDLKNESLERIVQGPEIILENMDNPAEAITRASAFLEPLLSSMYERWDKRRQDFNLLARLAERHRSLQGFLETYTLDPVNITQVEKREDEDVVALITAHSAKGTESPVCYLIRVEPGMYPHVRSLGDSDSEEEERRVLYVAMTRAKNELIVTRSLSRSDYTTFYGITDSGSTGTPYFLEGLEKNLVRMELPETGTINDDDSDIIIPHR